MVDTVMIMDESQQRIKKINWVFAATVLISLAAGFIPFGRITQNYAVLMILSQVILIIPAIVYLLKEKISFADAVRFRPVRPANIMLLILLTILITPLMTLINAISMLFAQNTTMYTMTNLASQNNLLIAVGTTALIPCIFEESVYRGIFYNEYRKVKPLAAIFLSAFLFGILHLNFNQFSYAFTMGIVFALIIEATDSILSTMIVHFFINAGSIVTLYAYPKLLAYLEMNYYSAIERGDYESSERITEFLGGTDFSMQNILQNSQQSMNSMTIVDVLRQNGLMALVCTILGFFVFRAIAVNAGRWDYIKRLFSNSSKYEEEKLEQGEIYGLKQERLETISYSVSVEENKRKHLITLPLAIAIIICFALMILNEM